MKQKSQKKQKSKVQQCITIIETYINFAKNGLVKSLISAAKAHQYLGYSLFFCAKYENIPLDLEKIEKCYNTAIDGNLLQCKTNNYNLREIYKQLIEIYTFTSDYKKIKLYKEKLELYK